MPTRPADYVFVKTPQYAGKKLPGPPPPWQCMYRCMLMLLIEFFDVDICYVTYDVAGKGHLSCANT